MSSFDLSNVSHKILIFSTSCYLLVMVQSCLSLDSFDFSNMCKRKRPSSPSVLSTQRPTQNSSLASQYLIFNHKTTPYQHFTSLSNNQYAIHRLNHISHLDVQPPRLGGLRSCSRTPSASQFQAQPILQSLLVHSLSSPPTRSFSTKHITCFDKHG